ncbi:MAG: hypothetical protein ACT4ON_10230 [Bacteroidota bacterium]
MKPTPMNCQYCQTPFGAKRNDAKFCSASCRQNAYLDRMKQNAKRKEAEQLSAKNQFSERINALETHLSELKQIQAAKLQQQREAQLQSISRTLGTIKHNETQRKIKETNGIVKEWLKQLLSFDQQNNISLFRLKFLCSDIIRFCDGNFSHLPPNYPHLHFINHTLLPKVKSWYENIKDSKEIYIDLQLSDGFKTEILHLFTVIDK